MPRPFGYKQSEETKQRISASKKGISRPWTEKQRQARIDHPQSPWNKGIKTGPISDDARRNHSIAGKLAHRLYPITEERRQNLSKALTGQVKLSKDDWQGGKAADDYAAVLCLAGFVREYRVDYGQPTIPMPYGGFRRPNFRMDFAHVEGKVDVEIDGRKHEATAEYDAQRDAILRELGWKIIRIKNYTRWS